MSIQCADADNRAARPYFVTFDLEAKRLVFESTTTSRHSGEIRSASNDRIEFSINVDYGKIDLVWQRQTNKMVWAGIGDGIIFLTVRWKANARGGFPKSSRWSLAVIRWHAARTGWQKAICCDAWELALLSHFPAEDGEDRLTMRPFSFAALIRSSL
jgi:hypothetical protein